MLRDPPCGPGGDGSRVRRPGKRLCTALRRFGVSGLQPPARRVALRPPICGHSTPFGAACLGAAVDLACPMGVQCARHFAQQGTEAAKKPEIPPDFPMTRPGVRWQRGAEEVSRGRAQPSRSLHEMGRRPRRRVVPRVRASGLRPGLTADPIYGAQFGPPKPTVPRGQSMAGADLLSVRQHEPVLRRRPAQRRGGEPSVPCPARAQSQHLRSRCAVWRDEPDQPRSHDSVSDGVRRILAGDGRFPAVLSVFGVGNRRHLAPRRVLAVRSNVALASQRLGFPRFQGADRQGRRQRTIMLRLWITPHSGIRPKTG